MKLFSTLAVTAIAAVSTALSAAEVIDMSKKEFWAPVKGVEFSEGQIVTKRAMFRSLKPIDIDTAKKYTLSMSVSTGEGKKQSTFLYGISPIAKNGRTCQAHNIQSIPGTFTEVAADAKKGATEIKVKNGAKWSTGTSAVIALNAKEDFSDIPNFTTVNVSVAKKSPGRRCLDSHSQKTSDQRYQSRQLYPSTCYGRLLLLQLPCCKTQSDL